MALVPYDPFKHLANMRNEMDRFFSDLPHTLENGLRFGGIRVDIHETDQEVVATCDIPGLEKKEDVSINVKKDLLQISGSVNRTSEVNEENMHRKERFSGSFERSVPLPSSVSTEGVKATYRNGVLEVRMPKLEQDDKTKVDVEFE